MSETSETSFIDIFSIPQGEITRSAWQISARDGTLLRGYRYDRQAPSPRGKKAIQASTADLICLPSELGNRKEVHAFILKLMANSASPKRVFSIDLRGRGTSETGSPESLDAETDSNDLISICDGLGLHHCDFLATGRNAHTVLLTTPKRPGMVRKLILNDGGPEFDAVGTARMNTLRKRANAPATWNDAVAQLKDIKGEQFKELAEQDWRSMAEMNWSESGGGLSPDISKKLIQLSGVYDFHSRQPELWMEFKLLLNRPVMLVRGETSLLITAQSADKLRKAHPTLIEIVVPSQGHTPLLHLGDTCEKIADFLANDALSNHP